MQPAYKYVCTMLLADESVHNQWDVVIRRCPNKRRGLLSIRLLDAVVSCYACRPPPPVSDRAEIESRYNALDRAARLLQEAFPGQPKVTIVNTREFEVEPYEGEENEEVDELPAEIRATLNAVIAQSDARSGSFSPADSNQRYYWEKWTLIPDALYAARKHLELEFDHAIMSTQMSDRLLGRKRVNAEQRTFCLKLAADFEKLLGQPHLDLVISICTTLFPERSYSLAALKAARHQCRTRE